MNMPTAKEFYESIVGVSPVGYTEEAMQEFARLHVKKALEVASSKACDDQCIDLKTNELFDWNGILTDGEIAATVAYKDSILNSYPLTNIK